jgi:hypothetical protein
MNDEKKINFVNYIFRAQVTSTYECSTESDPLPTIGNIPDETKNKPELLINIFDSKNPNTNYNNIINNPRLKDALFVYLSNEGNSGYAGGSGGGTAMIGQYNNTFGIITGILSRTPNLASGGFQDLNETNTFKLCHRADKKSYSMTPTQAIDYLLGQLYELIQDRKYSYIILPCDLPPNAISNDYHKYTLGSGIFNAHPDVKRYIYEKICSMSKAPYSSGWNLITDFLNK